MAESEGSADKVWTLAKGFRSCMLVTRDGESLRARPMAVTVSPEEHAFWFLTDEGSGKDHEIKVDHDICLAFSDGGSTHISVSGKAVLLQDRAKIRELFGPAAKAWWPDGPETPSIRALKLTPQKAEYWDGPNAVVAYAKMMTAAVTGSPPDMGDNAKVRL